MQMMRCARLLPQMASLRTACHHSIVFNSRPLTNQFLSSSLTSYGQIRQFTTDIMPPKRKSATSTRAGTKKATKKEEPAVEQTDATEENVQATADNADEASPKAPPAKKLKKTKSTGPIPHIPQKELPKTIHKGEYLLSTFNVNGLRAAIKNGFSNYMSSIDPKPNMIFLQETKGSESDFSSFLHEIEGLGYSVKYNSGSRPGYAGTAVLYDASLHPVTVKFDSTLAYPKPALGPFATANEPDADLVAQAKAKTDDEVTQKMREVRR